MTIQDKISTVENEIKILQEYIIKLKEKEKTQEIIKNNFPNIIETLLLLTPSHNKKSCSDNNHINKGTCNRCTILEIQEDGIWDDNLELSISISRI
jgi:hypothetical protein